jgi:hypothetical protein
MEGVTPVTKTYPFFHPSFFSRQTKGRIPMSARHLFLTSFTLCLASAAAFCQDGAEPPFVDKNNIASRYFLGKEHELLMAVNILGPVSKPGQYMLPSETDLISLVAYAGGFKVEAKTSDIKIVRKMGNQEQPKVIKVDLTKYPSTGDQKLSPLLMPDDTVIIGDRKVVPMKTVAEIARTVAYIAEVVYIFYLIDRR